MLSNIDFPHDFPHTWQPTASPANLELRGRLLWSIRKFFHDHGLCEVQTPVLSHDTVIDQHIDPIWLPGENLGLAEHAHARLYLQSSPEFCMKRLLAAGMNSIYQVAQVFRAGERGAYHNPEFTMIEWYRVGDDFVQGVQLLSELTKSVLGRSQVELLTYQHAFEQYVGIDPLNCDVQRLADAASRFELGVNSSWSDERDEWLNLLFAEVVQPRLGLQHPVIILRYPASQSALARISADDPRVAERYELFIDGIELANGYHELLQADELERRNRLVLEQRARAGKALLPAESRLLTAMQAGLPACSGCALGFDRLVTVATNAKSIDEAIAFPIERA